MRAERRPLMRICERNICTIKIMSEGQEHHDGSQKSGRRWPLPKWLTMLLLVFVILLAGFTAWHIGIRGAVSAELQAIRDRGEPTTMQEVEDWYPQPNGPNLAVAVTDAADLLVELPDVPLEIPSDMLAEAEQRAKQVAIARAVEMGDSPEDYENWVERGDFAIAGVWIDEDTTLNTFRPGTGEAVVKPGVPIHPLVLRALEQAVTLNEPAITKMHAASGYETGRHDLQGNNIWWLNTDLNRLRTVSYVLQEDAMWAAHRGNSQRATDSLIASLATGRSLENEPSLIAHLVRIACDAIVFTSIQDTMLRTELSEPQLDALAEALAPIEYDTGMRRGMIGDRVIGIQDYQNPSVFSDRSRYGDSKFQVMAHRAAGTLHFDHLQYLELMRRMIDTIELPRHERVAAMEAAVDETLAKENNFLYDWSTPFSLRITPSLGRYIEITHSVQASLDITRLGLAIELYRIEQNKLPDSLEDLTPTYFKTVPLDPFSGKPYRFRKLEPGYVVYSVGEEGVDEGGAMRDPQTGCVHNVTYADFYTAKQIYNNDYDEEDDCDITFFNDK